jgi:hypothetical protein
VLLGNLADLRELAHFRDCEQNVNLPLLAKDALRDDLRSGRIRAYVDCFE